MQKVQNHPSNKPIMIYDGECKMCCRWIERWKKLAKEANEYQPYQEVSSNYLEINIKEFQKSVHLIDTEGNVYKGAHAVFKSLANNFLYRGLLKLYTYFSPFKWISELMYVAVAKNRSLISKIEGFFWGFPKHPISYQKTSILFLKVLGLIYFSAFISMYSQVLGLVGSDGILPVSHFLNRVDEVLGSSGYIKYPTIFWVSSSDFFLKFICLLGALFSLFIVLGFLTLPSLILCWFFYLSIAIAGQTFFTFQWDYLLLEVGFLALFLSPKNLGFRVSEHYMPSKLIVFLHRWLLFRLMFASGILKWLAGDPVWRDLSALSYHYESQPLPTWIAWYAHQLPLWFHKLSTVGMYFIEVLVPFLIFFPRKVRYFASFLIIFLMIAILLTGNYCFFNLLTIALCILLFDDSIIPSRIQLYGFPKKSVYERSGSLFLNIKKTFLIVIALAIFLMTLASLSNQIFKDVKWTRQILYLNQWVRPIRSFNNYGLFVNMTTVRREIVIQGSYDGKNWKDYEFKWKPGDLIVRPKFNLPHQPRVDWQMWFAALGDIRRNPWMLSFVEKLLKESDSVIALLKKNPFEDSPPKFIRAVIYLYKFSDKETKLDSGEWWVKSNPRLYFPPIKLKD